MTIQEQRRKAFEAWHATNGMPARLGVPTETAFKLNDDGEYAFNGMHFSWQAWNAALDSVEIELPNKLHTKPYACYEGGWNDALLETADLIEGMGLRVKP